MGGLSRSWIMIQKLRNRMILLNIIAVPSRYPFITFTVGSDTLSLSWHNIYSLRSTTIKRSWQVCK